MGIFSFYEIFRLVSEAYWGSRENLQDSLSLFCTIFSFNIFRYFLNNDVSPAQFANWVERTKGNCGAWQAWVKIPAQPLASRTPFRQLLHCSAQWSSHLLAAGHSNKGVITFSHSIPNGTWQVDMTGSFPFFSLFHFPLFFPHFLFKLSELTRRPPFKTEGLAGCWGGSYKQSSTPTFFWNGLHWRESLAQGHSPF